MRIVGTHHVAVICSDYARSKQFYTEVLGLEVAAEVYRAARDSYKLDLKLPDGTQVELFSFLDPTPRPTSTRRSRTPKSMGSRSSPCRWTSTPASGSPFSPTPTGCRSNSTSGD